MSTSLKPDLMKTYLDIADILIPEAEGMPSASQVDVGGAVLDRILSLRPDLREAFLRGLHAALGKDPLVATRALNNEDTAALDTIGLIAASAYYMHPRVRELIGYAGQISRAYEATTAPEYVLNGMLQKVIDRGPIYRPTPK